MSDTHACQNCGSLLPNNAPEGLCPRCLIRAALDSDVPSGTGQDEAGATVSRSVANPGVLDTIAATIGSVPRVLLRDTGPGEQPSPLVKASSPEMAAGPGRLQLFGEIARGGMGAVLKGRDPDLGRDLAVKVLLEGHRDNPDLVRRFVEEAQIGGQLQHPGVVPVYELGQFADARPYFAMKLVKGHTLAEVLKDRVDPRSALSTHVATWVQIAQTTAYAHARGVIHRDLKPSNVMLGSFGEVQVMDWGLAKVLPRGGVVDDKAAGKLDVEETVIATARSGSDDSDRSHAGSILGTPSYMAPEQARGEIDRLDERCDVFALGSILCEILTGQPAFTGRTSAEILLKAARGDLTDARARLDACGADIELVGLAKDCLATEADERPRDAGVVAARGLAYQAGVQEKLRKAELDRVEERGRRRLTTLAAAAVLLLGFSGGGGYLWVHQQRAERVARTSRAIDNALTDVARLRGEAQANPASAATKLAEARSAAKRAEALLAQGEAEAPLRNRVSALLAGVDREEADAAETVRRLEVDHVLLTDLETVRGDRAEHLDPKRTDAEYVAAFRKAGLDLDMTEPAEAGKWLATRSEPVEMAGYLDDWVTARQAVGRPEADWRRLVAAARGADPDPWRDALRVRFGSNDAGAVAEFRRLADDAALEDQSAAGLLLLAHQLRFGVGDRERATRVLRRAALRYPGDFRIHFELAHAPGEAFESHPNLRDLYPHAEEAVRHLTSAVAIRPRSVSAHVVLGRALNAHWKFDEAVAEYREAIRLKPDDAEAHSMLGNVLRWQGKFDEALAECREAIRLKSDDPVTHQCLGLILMGQGKHAEAVTEHREAIRLKPDYVVAHYYLGNTLSAQGKSEEALAEYREAIRLKPNSTAAHYVLGNFLKAQGKRDEALAEYREAIRLKPDDAESYELLGRALNALGKRDEAVTEYNEAIRRKPDDANAHRGLAGVLNDQGKRDEAVAEYRTAIRLRPDYPNAYRSLADVLRAQRKHAEAVTEYREALRLKPDDAATRYYLGNVLSALGKNDEALAEYREAARIDTDSGHTGFAIFVLGDRLNELGRHDEALTVFRRSLELAASDASPDNSTLAKAHSGLGRTLIAQGKLDEAVAEYRAVIRFKADDAEAKQMVALGDRLPALLKGADHPRDAAERLTLVRLCRDMKFYATAARLQAEAVEANPTLGNDPRSLLRYNASCASALAGCGAGQDEPPLDDARKAELRRQALDWLKLDLALQSQQLATGTAEARRDVGRAMAGWKTAPDLAGVRDPTALSRLPEAESEQWRMLWEDVEALLKQAAGGSS